MMLEKHQHFSCIFQLLHLDLLKYCIFTKCLQLDLVQLPCSFCVELITSSHQLPVRSFLHSRTSPCSMQGEVMLQESPALPLLRGTSSIVTCMFWCILSRKAGKNLKQKHQFNDSCLTDWTRNSYLPVWCLKGQYSTLSPSPHHAWK